MRATLVEIAGLLEEGSEEQFAASLRAALAGSGQALEEFLISNELWGGAGSIADQALVTQASYRRASTPARSPQRVKLEDLLIQLGKMQLSLGAVNVRTSSWVEVFEKWRQPAI